MKRRDRIVPAYKQARVNRLLARLEAQHAHLDRLIAQAYQRLQRDHGSLTGEAAAPAASTPSAGTR
jgi:hypothetical protein